MKELPEHILCNNKIEFLECAKFLLKIGQTVVNFDGEKFLMNDMAEWMGFCFESEENCWGRFYTKRKRKSMKNIEVPPGFFTGLNRPEQKPMKLTQKNVINAIIDGFRYEMNTKENRTRIINELNRLFFPDNIAKFIDVTSEEDVDSGHLSILIEYKGTQYNLLAFEDEYIKIERKRKLIKLERLNEMY